jgi:DNA-binding response OmpR family regulator
MMTALFGSHAHLRILVVEDEYLLADGMQHELEKLGVLVIGPALTVATALRLLDAALVVDGAILDINLGGEKSFPIADALHEHSIPFVFASGYDSAMIPEPYRNVRCFEKPVDLQDVIRAIVA